MSPPYKSVALGGKPPACPPYLLAVPGRAWQFFIRVTVNVHILSTDVAITSPANSTLWRESRSEVGKLSLVGGWGWQEPLLPCAHSQWGVRASEPCWAGFLRLLDWFLISLMVQNSKGTKGDGVKSPSLSHSRGQQSQWSVLPHTFSVTLPGEQTPIHSWSLFVL